MEKEETRVMDRDTETAMVGREHNVIVSTVLHADILRLQLLLEP